jgi:dienelactone hydrolase
MQTSLRVVLYVSIVCSQIGVVVAEDKPVTIERLGEEASRAIAGVFEYDASIPLEERVVEKVDEGESVREKIVFRSTQGFLVPGYLEIPNGATKPAPCVLLLHGWSGSKQHWWQDDNYISGGNVRRGLLKAGFAVLALDAQCHGDRISQNDFAPVNHYIAKGDERPRKGYFSQREIYVQSVVDYRRAIDYLQTRADIDPDRIGAFGYSMGGTQTYLLTGVETRIKACVACATPADNSKWSLLAPQNYASALGDTPFLVVMGKHDPMCPAEHARSLYKLFESDQTELMFFDGDHKISHDYAPVAVEWIVGKL